MGKKFFINNLNTYIGNCLFSEIRDDVGEDGEVNEDANVIYGTYIDEENSNYPNGINPRTEKPLGIKKMLKRSKPRLTMKYISECDVIIYDLHTGNPKDIELALSAFEKYKIDEESEGKTLILISSVAVWKNTEPKLVEIKPEGYKKEGEGEGDGEGEGAKEGEGNEKKEAEGDAEKPANDTEGDNPQGEGEEAEGEGAKKEGEGEGDKAEELPPPEYENEPYTEAEYNMRNPPEDYQKIKELEDKILELNKPGLKTFVVCSGIIYGNGETETVFNDKFKSAWLQSPQYLPYVEDGENKIPTIHSIDLARLVKKVYETKPENKYVFAIDNTDDRQQKSLIQAISSGIGTGKVESKKFQVDEMIRFTSRLELADRPNSTLSIDLNLKPSALMVAPTNDEEAEPVEFPWHCEKGLAANIKKVKEEFCKMNNLVPIKIFINGPPLSGKTFFSEKIADHFRIPLVNLKTLIPELEAIDLEEGEKNEVVSAMKEWKKNNDKKQYPNEILYEMVRNRLQQNDCQQRGFVLDGFPRTYEDAKGLFYHTLKKKEKPKKPENEGEGEGDAEPQEEVEEEEEEDTDKYKPKFQTNIYPESIIMLQAADDFLMQKAKKLPDEIMKNSHYYENHMERRLQNWHKGNSIDDYRYGLEPGKAKLTTARFFQEKETEILDIEANVDNFELFEAMRVYIERHGRPYNYLPSLERLNNDRHIYLDQKEDDVNQKLKAEETSKAQKKEKDEARLQRLSEDFFSNIEEHVKGLQQVKETKPREFLMKNIVPTLSEGLIEITKVAPIDPIDYLADYIFKKSNC